MSILTRLRRYFASRRALVERLAAAESRIAAFELAEQGWAEYVADHRLLRRRTDRSLREIQGVLLETREALAASRGAHEVTRDALRITQEALRMTQEALLETRKQCADLLGDCNGEGG